MKFEHWMGIILTVATGSFFLGYNVGKYEATLDQHEKRIERIEEKANTPKKPKDRIF